MNLNYKYYYNNSRLKIPKILTVAIIIVIITSLIRMLLVIDDGKITVCIDPGHGGYDVGTKAFNGDYEKEISLDIALKVGKILEDNDINVVYTRFSDDVPWPSDEKLDLRHRVKLSKDSKADIFVSIHGNGSKNASYKGIETWCRFPNSEGEDLAKSIHKELVSLGYSSDRKIKYESEKSLAVLKLNETVQAAVLVELGFLSNPEDAKYITSSQGKELCSKAIANGILSYMK